MLFCCLLSEAPLILFVRLNVFDVGVKFSEPSAFSCQFEAELWKFLV